MDIRTENLTILFVDIAGFTATTARQSRAENAKLLHTFDSTLLPLIRGFKGNVVKSIGDALLITFRSPTDAMLCTMALQDAMHEHNLQVSEEDKIHIRVAANLGEVRVTKKDIFGEPVNVAARIEGVTPADEIYLSEAVYMAMNKAEVPAQEVGFKELSGVPQPVRLYSIPRFATPRLVPTLPQAQGSELLFPYGGMHHRVPGPKFGLRKHFTASGDEGKRSALKLALPLLLLLSITAAAWYWLEPTEPTLVAKPVVDAAQSPAATDGSAPASEPEANIIASSAQAAPAVEAPDTSATSAKQQAAAINTVPVASKSESKPAQPAVSKPQSEPKVASVSAPTTSNASINTPSVSKQATSKTVWNVTTAKAAYRAGQLNKQQYRDIVNELETVYDAKIRQLKLDYKAGKISRSQYDQAVREAKQIYSGR